MFCKTCKTIRMKGKLIIFSAPSGSGKTTIVKYLLKQGLNLYFSVSATNRQPRPGEINGKDYYFFTTDEFLKKIENNEFLEWEEVYEGIYYGTLVNEVEQKRKSGKNIIFDVDVVGGLNIKKIYGDEALAVFVKPPSLKELKKRLTIRSTETKDKIEMRIQKAKKELLYSKHFDVVIINDDLRKALAEASGIVSDFTDNT